MENKKVTALDAIRAFYIGNELLGDVFKAVEKDRSINIETEIKKVVTKANKISKEKLLRYHLDNWHPRYDNYFNSSWELKEVELKDCGVWPKMGGLPIEATTGCVLDTVTFIKPYLEDKNKLTLKTSRILYIEEMMKYAELITKHIPIVVMEDGVIRHHKLIKSSEKKLYSKCKYDIDDGNHRAIAYGLLGKDKILALAGRRIYKSKLLY